MSVVIPVYNGEKTLGEQLNALHKQTYSGIWEIIVVDNGSSDKTVDMVESYQKFIPNLRLKKAIGQKNSAYTRNVGVQYALGQKILFCDADDVVCPVWVEKMAEGLDQGDIVSGLVDIDKLNHSLDWKRPQPHVIGEKILDFLPFASGCNVGVSRKVYETVDGFSENFLRGQDVDFSWKVQLAGFKMSGAPEAVVYYRFRKKASLVWVQISNDAFAHVVLYKKFSQFGMPRSSLKRAFKQYYWLLRNFPKFLFGSSHQFKEKWLYKSAFVWGRIKGSIINRTLYL